MENFILYLKLTKKELECQIKERGENNEFEKLDGTQ